MAYSSASPYSRFLQACLEISIKYLFLSYEGTRAVAEVGSDGWGFELRRAVLHSGTHNFNPPAHPAIRPMLNGLAATEVMECLRRQPHTLGVMGC